MCRAPSVFVLALPLLCFACAPKTDYCILGPYSIAADNSEVFLAAGTLDDMRIYALNVSDSTTRQLTFAPQGAEDPSVSPDGRSIAFSASPDSSDPHWHIWAMDRDGRNQRQLTSGDNCDSTPTFSPDGKKILFMRATRYHLYSMSWYWRFWIDWDLWQMNADGSSPEQLTHNRYYSMDPPHYTSDGKSALFAAVTGYAPDEGQSHYLLRLDLTPGADPEPVPLPDDPSKHNFDGDPCLSPDGKTIAFSSLRASGDLYDYELWTAHVDGTDLRQITHDQWRAFHPLFSPDGKFIYFQGDGAWLYRMNLDGSGTQVLRFDGKSGFTKWELPN